MPHNGPARNGYGGCANVAAWSSKREGTWTAPTWPAHQERHVRAGPSSLPTRTRRPAPTDRLSRLRPGHQQRYRRPAISDPVPPTGAPNAKVGVVTGEGDIAITGDLHKGQQCRPDRRRQSLGRLLRYPGHRRAAGAAGATDDPVETSRNPAFSNMMAGPDTLAAPDTIPNDVTSTTVDGRTNGETYARLHYH